MSQTKKLIQIDQAHLVPQRIPVITLKDLAFFPGQIQPLTIGRSVSLKALTNALGDEGYVLFLAQKNSEMENPLEADIYQTGVISRILETTWLSNGHAEVVFQGIERAKFESLDQSGTSLTAKFLPIPSKPSDVEKTDYLELIQKVHELFIEYSGLRKKHSIKLESPILSTNDPVRFGFFISSSLDIKLEEKQQLLEEESTSIRYDSLNRILEREINILSNAQVIPVGPSIIENIENIVNDKERSHQTQQEMFPVDQEWLQIASKITLASLPSKVSERTHRELDRLKNLGPMTPESAVIRNYLDWITGLPWTPKTTESSSLERASQSLDEAHYGLKDLKDRILDHIAVLSLVGELRGSIICLVGPPGVGKTSLGSSIATALDRDFVRISLGGIRDEAEIRGHRRTYVGALPGRILQEK